VTADSVASTRSWQARPLVWADDPDDTNVTVRMQIRILSRVSQGALRLGEMIDWPSVVMWRGFGLRLSWLSKNMAISQRNLQR